MVMQQESTSFQLSAAILLLNPKGYPAVEKFSFLFNGIHYKPKSQSSDGYFVFVGLLAGSYYELEINNPNYLTIQEQIIIPQQPTSSNAVFSYQLTPLLR